MNLDAATRSERQFNRRKAMLLAGIAIFAFVGITVAQLSRFFIGGRGTLNVGDVAPRDLRVPRRASYISEFETNRLRDLAEASVAPIFSQPDAQISRQQLIAARDQMLRISQTRNNTQTPIEDRIRQLTAPKGLTETAISPISEALARKLLAFSETSWARVETQVISVLDVALRSSIQPDNLVRTQEMLTGLISLSLSTDEALAVQELARPLLVPNTAYDATATQIARQRARDLVLPVERTVEANQVLVRSGQVVREIEAEALEMLNMRRPGMALADVLSAGIFSALGVVMLGAGMVYGHGNVFTRSIRSTLLSVFLIIVTLLLTRWLLPGHGLLPYLVPIVAVSLSVTIWSGTLPGIIAGIMLAALASLDLDKPAEFTAYFACGALIGCLALGRAERLSSFARAGIAAALGQALVILAFNLPDMQSQDVPQLASYLVASLFSGVFSAALAPLLLYLSGLVLDITTLLQLIELSRPSHPLLQQMLLQAPGTYHHSLMVANLSEQAAERIGADSLMTRIGAYYHDIGKLVNPHFFIENQLQGMNVHDQLDPATSAAILRNHVTDGMKLARQYRLPSNIQAFIAEHHGTTKMRYQLALATQDNAEPPDLSQFTYPGPRPRSKETALVMLADGCEAIVRAQRPANLDGLEAAVRQILTDRLADHQLDDSNLTLKELDQIRQSFMDTLRGAYHPRIQYPPTLRNAPGGAATPTTSIAEPQEGVADSPSTPTNSAAIEPNVGTI